VLRLDKLRADPARDAERMAQARAGAALLAPGGRAQGRAGRAPARAALAAGGAARELFAQELRTPQPVSVKRLDKVWAQMR
jgi:ATP-dependent helicase HrpA